MQKYVVKIKLEGKKLIKIWKWFKNILLKAAKETCEISTINKKKQIEWWNKKSRKRKENNFVTVPL